MVDISLNETIITLQANKTAQIQAKVFPLFVEGANLTYVSSDTKVATVSANGQIAGVIPGIAEIRVIAGSVEKKITVLVKPAKVSSVKKKSLSSGKVRLTWKKQNGVTGYKIYQYNTKSKKYKLCKTVKTNKVTISKLKKGQTYKFKIRAYKKTSGATILGNYSNIIKVK